MISLQNTSGACRHLPIIVCWLTVIVAVPGAEVTGKVSAAGHEALAGALVRVLSVVPSTVALPTRPSPVLTVRGGKVEPATVVVLTNEPFTLTNASGVLYNVHFRFKESIERNVALTGSAPHNRKTIVTSRAELFARVSEDLHRLDGYICVVENPFFALTDAAGKYTLPDLPPGTYTIEAAHPRTGRVQREVTVSGASQPLKFELPAK